MLSRLSVITDPMHLQGDKAVTVEPRNQRYAASRACNHVLIELRGILSVMGPFVYFKASFVFGIYSLDTANRDGLISKDRRSI